MTADANVPAADVRHAPGAIASSVNALYDVAALLAAIEDRIDDSGAASDEVRDFAHLTYRLVRMANKRVDETIDSLQSLQWPAEATR